MTTMRTNIQEKIITYEKKGGDKGSSSRENMIINLRSILLRRDLVKKKCELFVETRDCWSNRI